MARKSGKGQSASRAGGSRAAETEKQPGGSAADKEAGTSNVGLPRAADEEREKKELVSRRVSLKKSQEVSEDVFAKESLKPVRSGSTEKKAGPPTRTGSSKMAATNDDAEEKKSPQAKAEDSREGGETQQDAKDVTESKRDIAEAKDSGKTAEESAATAVDKKSSNAAEEKSVSSASVDTPEKRGRVPQPGTVEDDKKTSPGTRDTQEDDTSNAGPRKEKEKRRTLLLPHLEEQASQKDSQKGGETQQDTKGVSESKRDAAEAKDSGKTADENAATSIDKESSKPGEEKDVALVPRDEQPEKGGGVSPPETVEEDKKHPPGTLDKQQEDISGAGHQDEQKKRKTLLVPGAAGDPSTAISASIKMPMPEEVTEAEKKFEEAENVFVKAKNRAEELLQEGKNSEQDAEVRREAKHEAAAAAAQAKSAEAAVQQALKEEVRAFLDLEGGEAKKPAATGEAAELDTKGAAERTEKSKKMELAEKTAEATKSTEAGKERAATAEEGEGTGTRSTGAERGKAEEAGVSSETAADKEVGERMQEGVAEKEKGKSEGSVVPPALKVSPAHLLEYSKRRSSDREAILAALAVVGLDTPETRAVVAAAEQEAAAAAEKEAAAAAEKAAAEASGGEVPPSAELSPFQKKTLAKLEGNQQYVLLLQQRMHEEIEALRDKYDRLMEPVFDERARILFNGGDEEQDEEGASGKNAHEAGKTEDDTGEKGDLKEGKLGDAAAESPKKGEVTESAREATDALLQNEVGTRALPGFWLQVFSNHSLLASLIGQRDKPLFLYLQNVRRVFHVEKADGFSLVFEFGDNPFFTPQTLTKTFKMKEEAGGGEWVVARTEGTAIQWAEGMDVTMRIIMRKQLNMRTKSERMVKEYITEKSFFHFFKNSVVPTEEELDSMPDEEQTRIYTQLKTEYDAGVVIRDLLIPYAVHWYLGIAAEEFERSSDESETEAETSPAAKKKTSAAPAAPPAQEEDTASSFASWFGF